MRKLKHNLTAFTLLLPLLATGPVLGQDPQPNPRVMEIFPSGGAASPVSETPGVIKELEAALGPAPVNLAIVVLDLVEDFTDTARREPVDFFYITADRVIYIDDAMRSSSSTSYPYYDSFPLTIYSQRPTLPTEDNPEPPQPKPVARLDSLPDGINAAVFVIAERSDGGYSALPIPVPPVERAQATVLNFTDEAMAVSIDGRNRMLDAKSHAAIPLEGVGLNGERSVFRLAMRHEENGEWRRVYARRFSLSNDENAVILIYRPTTGTRPFRVLPILDLAPKSPPESEDGASVDG